MTSLVTPQINLNGSSRKSLVEQQIDVLDAFNTLLKVMHAAAPNGRDYQLRPDEYRPARDAWFERMKIIDDMRQEIEVHALAIQG